MQIVAMMIGDDDDVGDNDGDNVDAADDSVNNDDSDGDVDDNNGDNIDAADDNYRNNDDSDDDSGAEDHVRNHLVARAGRLTHIVGPATFTSCGLPRCFYACLRRHHCNPRHYDCHHGHYQ